MKHKYMKHKYIFYYFKTDQLKSMFMFFERVKDGKELARKRSCNYDYEKLY